LRCRHCNKEGHIATKCWNKPPYYCPKCKTQGHSLQNCPERGKKNSKENSSKSTDRIARLNKKKERRKEKEDEDSGLLMLHSKVPISGKILEHALQVRTAK